jgi:tRNA G18 (ribose-2'-O)-methylase SpoU
MKFTIVLENIRSAWNVGSIIRSCDAMNFDLILVGYTPRPEGKTLDMVKKTSIGAEKTVNISYFTHSIEVFENYKEVLHYGIEISSQSLDLFEYLSKGILDNNTSEVFLWFGNEIHGLSSESSQNVIKQLHLPMKGSKESLNVATSVTAAGYTFLARKNWFEN